MARKRGSHAKVSIADAKGREQLVLWRSPRITLYYFLLEVILHLKNYGNSLWHNKKKACLFLVVVFFSVLPYFIQGPHHQYLDYMSSKLWWCFYWVGLGVLSSVGLGTGLHTFLLYLGPHIAAVTMAAYECQSLKFPQPPYPDDIICPETAEPNTVSMWSIMSKVRLEAFMWGAGTAMGELPPYFMARAARLSGTQDDEELEEFEKLLKKKKKHDSMSWLERAKLSVEKIVERVGFLGILACASIPNPLFDLAGITCGHFLVPFWTFFGATLLGKAVIKMHIQKVFVILAFNENLLQGAVSLLLYIPYIGKGLQAPFYDFLVKQKAKLHRSKEKPVQTGTSLLSSMFEVLIMIMVAYFLLSIVNSFAQTYHKRLQKQNKKKKARD